MSTPVRTLESRIDADGLELSFVGRDQDADDACDMDNFMRNIQVSNEPRTLPFGLPSFVIGLLYLLTAPLLFSYFPEAVLATFVGLVIVLVVFNLLGLAIMDRRYKLPEEQRFTLRMARDRFTFRGERCAERTVALRDVIAFESGRRLSIIMGNGARIVLPCVRPMAPNVDPHAEIAHYLNDEVGRSRSARVGYRGEELESVEHGAEWQNQGASLERAAHR